MSEFFAGPYLPDNRMLLLFTVKMENCHNYRMSFFLMTTGNWKFQQKTLRFLFCGSAGIFPSPPKLFFAEMPGNAPMGTASGGLLIRVG